MRTGKRKDTERREKTMGRIAFKAAYKTPPKFEDFPRLKLATGERALINVFDDEPTMEWVHTLRAPAIGPDGQVLTEEKKNRKGELFTAQVTDFVGSHLCFGDSDTLEARGIDPDNCPTCKASRDEKGFDAPQPRYAVHVLRYGLQPNSWKVRSPFSVEVVAWTFSGTKFDDLVDLAEEFAEEGESLRDHDLRLSCINGMYQNLDIKPAQSAAWSATDDTRSIALQTFESNRSSDLASVIARRANKDQVLDDIERVRQKIAESQGETRSTAFSQTLSNNQVTVDNVLDSPAKPESGEEDWTNLTDVDAFLNDLDD